MAHGVDELKAREDKGVLIKGMRTSRGDQPWCTTKLGARLKSREVSEVDLNGTIVMISNLLLMSTGSVLEDPGVNVGAGEEILTLIILLLG